MAVYLRGNVYYYDFRAGGKRFRGSTGATNRRSALAFEKKHIEKMRGETSAKQLIENVKEHLLGDSILLEEAFSKFKKIPRSTIPSKDRMKNYESKWGDFVSFMMGEYPEITKMNQVQSTHAQEYIQHLRTKGRYNKEVSYKRGKRRITHNAKLANLAPSTINDAFQLLRMVFNTLKNEAGIIENPFAEIKNLKQDKIPREAFTPEELKLIGEKSQGTYLYPLFRAGISTGMREGDICTLLWKEVDIAAGWINRKTLKTGKKIHVPILPSLKQYLLSIPKENEYVFPELANIYINSRSKIGSDVTDFLEGIGITSTKKIEGRDRRVSIKDIHSLRHTFAYLAGLNNIPLPIVQGILGHMSSKMTEHYTNHAGAEEKKQFLAQIPDYLSGGVKLEVSARDLLISMNDDNWQEIRDKLLLMV